MFSVEGTTIILSKGDTGAVEFDATVTLDGDAYTFSSDDRALFSIKNATGIMVKQKAYELTDNDFIVYFLNSDTDGLSPGNYQWDVRYVINPYYDDDGNIIDGDQVITPMQPQTMTLLPIVGEI